MNHPKHPKLPETQALDEAFNALASYDHGSSRGELMPIDQAAFAAAASPEFRATLEARLLAALRQTQLSPAREYIASKLALIGSGDAASAFKPETFISPADTAIRTALEAIPGPQATKALLALLPKSSGDQKLGVIASLGIRHDANTVRALTSLLEDEDPKVVTAAAGALARTGTRAAGNALRKFVPKNDNLRQAYADAALTCADHLLADGHKADAQELYARVNQPQFPAHVRQAAGRGLKACT